MPTPSAGGYPVLELCAGKDLGGVSTATTRAPTYSGPHPRSITCATWASSPRCRSRFEPCSKPSITLVVALGIAWLGQAFVIKPYRVPTPSMVPTLEPGDRVLADRLSLDFENPGRGQIVVFHPPHCKSGFDDSSGVCTTPRLSAARRGSRRRRSSSA